MKRKFFLLLLAAAGLDVNDAKYKTLLEKAPGEDDVIELDQTQFGEVSGRLLNVEAAKSHTDVSKHFKALYRGEADKAVVDYLKEAGLDEAAIKAVTDGHQTPDKIKAALAHVRTMNENGKGGDDRENQWKVKEQEFQSKITTLQKQYQDEVDARVNDQRDFALTGLLTSDAIKLRADLPKDTALAFAKMQINTLLTQKKAAIVVKDGKPVLVDAEDPTKGYFEPGSGTAADLTDLVRSTLTTAGLISTQPGKVEGGTGSTGGQGSQGGQQGSQRTDQVDDLALASRQANMAILDSQVAAGEKFVSAV